MVKCVSLSKSLWLDLCWMSPTIIYSAVLFGCAFFKSAPSNAGTSFMILATLRTMSKPVNYSLQALSFLIQIEVSFERRC